MRGVVFSAVFAPVVEQLWQWVLSRFIVEGTVANVPPQGGRKHPHQEFIQINTANILFVVGGAFVGLDKIVERRAGDSTSIGFGANPAKTQAERELEAAKARNELSLIEVKCSIGARDDLGRPTTTALENKENFMDYIK